MTRPKIKTPLGPRFAIILSNSAGEIGRRTVTGEERVGRVISEWAAKVPVFYDGDSFKVVELEKGRPEWR